MLVPANLRAITLASSLETLSKGQESRRGVRKVLKASRVAAHHDTVFGMHGQPSGSQRVPNRVLEKENAPPDTQT